MNDASVFLYMQISNNAPRNEVYYESHFKHQQCLVCPLVAPAHFCVRSPSTNKQWGMLTKKMQKCHEAGRAKAQINKFLKSMIQSMTTTWGVTTHHWIMLLQLCARAARRWCPVDKANCQQSEGSWLRFILLLEEETTYRKSSKGELCFARVMQWNYVKGAMSMWKRSYLLEYLYLDINKAMIRLHCRSSLESETTGLNCSGALRYHLQDCAAARGSHHIATSSAYASWSR